MSTEAQNQDPASEVSAAVAAQSGSVAQWTGAAQTVAKQASEPKVATETAVVADAAAEAGSRGALRTAKPTFEITFELRRRALDRPVREPDAADGDDAQPDQR
ncbi:hypothetical protein [Catenulispora acidiphila]|uniref:hypothetical protein n=1 Tax=Catenulispora acidiphila TaxID=304895 RepID=UPI00019DE73A|nr:hypothetical protein [Catenulispora acidiphila]